MSDDLYTRKAEPVRAVRWMKRGDARIFGAAVEEAESHFHLAGAGWCKVGDWIVEIGAGQLVHMTDDQFTCLYESYDPRPSFTLKPSDPLAPDTIRHWISLAILSNVPEAKISAAQAVVENIERSPGRRHYPD